MELEKVKEYLQVYIDDVLIPKVNSELASEKDEPITITAQDIKQKVHNPDEIVVFLNMEPDWLKSVVVDKIYDDIVTFMRMMGYSNNWILVRMNQKILPIYEPR